MLNRCRNVGALAKNVRTFMDLVRIVEVGARDGLQNIKHTVPTATKIELINRLSDTGLRSIQAASFVSDKWVPQMADAKEVFNGIERKAEIDYPVIVPNPHGLQRALALGVQEVEMFVGASETFNQKNINSSIEASLRRFKEMRETCRQKKVRVRGIISCAMGCPYEGEVSSKRVAKIAEAFLEMGCYEVALADTNGVGTPRKFGRLFAELRAMTGGDVWRFAVHCHDTYGQAIVNVYECLEQGIRVFDASVAGLGGCPYSPGATGNVATEDLVYLLNGQGMTTGVDIERLAKVGDFIVRCIPGQENHSKVGNALLARGRQADSS